MGNASRQVSSFIVHRNLIGKIGEMFDLEALSKVCAEKGRYTFFFSSWPLNMSVLVSDSYVLLLAESHDVVTASAVAPVLRTQL